MLPDFRVRQRDYLLEITKVITQELDVDKVLERILVHAADLLAGQAGLVALRTEEGHWQLAASYGIPEALREALNPILAAVPDNEDPARFQIPKVNQILQRIAREVSLGLLTGVGLPLVARNRVIGVIFIFRNYRGRFSANDRSLLQSFADQAGVAVQNAQLYAQSRREKQRLDAILDSVADGILILSQDYTIERANPAFARLYGQSAAEITGQTHDQIIRFDEVAHGPTLDEAEAGGWPLTANATLYVEGDLKIANGTHLPVGVTYAPLQTPDNQLLNLIASVRDVTRFREAEELQSTFMSVISHELKTPVALIKGYVGTLRREDLTLDRKTVEDSLTVIEDEADHLTELIENLLDASRLEAGILPIDSTDLSLEILVSRLVERFRTQSDAHQFVIDFPDDFPVILGDERRIGQVLLNLFSNAVKYSAEGGEIRISGETRAEQVIVCVEDPGPGISPGDIPHIFGRFYRADSAQRNTKGVGLGLYLSRAIIEAHKGSIWVDPAPEAGARICFSLPRQN
jgi:PAS domain S-box-containing protein